MLRSALHRYLPLHDSSLASQRSFSTLPYHNHVRYPSNPLRRSFLVTSRPRASAFHSTPSRHGLPVVPLLVALLKSSTSLEIARTAGRIALTFIPVVLFTNKRSEKRMKYAAIHGIPTSEESKATVLRQIRHRKLLLYALFLVPISLFWATIVASLERTPLTGRWRMIILSPEEEEEIAAQLAGNGWYRAVGDILAQDGPTRIIPSTDWRYAWVNDTLRRLETTIPILTHEPNMYPQWLEEDQSQPPLPPPAKFPLRPRPRASEYLRQLCESICERKVPPVPHAIPGPPYSLLIVDKPDASNAFSYGFGPDGGGGIVVYSGFLNDVLSRSPPQSDLLPASESVENKSWWSQLVSIFFPSKPVIRHPTPTPEQTTELAILLAHELSHLILSHHLESLSSATVIIPGTISMISDIVRVLIFPFTMIFGPFVNDAVAQLGKVGSGELVKVGEYCTNVKQEIEADVVSARLLAHAGFDARDAVKFWRDRSETIAECSRTESLEDITSRSSGGLARRIMGSSSHPMNEVRVRKLEEELERWEAEKQVIVAKMKAAP